MPKAKTKTKKRTASQIGKASRAKGKAFEQEVARAFREIYGEQVKRGWQARQGSDAPDVEGIPGWWVECKHHRRVNVQASWKQIIEAQYEAQAKKDPRADDNPLLVHHDTGGHTLVTLMFSDFLSLLEDRSELFADTGAQKRRAADAALVVGDSAVTEARTVTERDAYGYPRVVGGFGDVGPVPLAQPPRRK